MHSLYQFKRIVGRDVVNIISSSFGTLLSHPPLAEYARESSPQTDGPVDVADDTDPLEGVHLLRPLNPFIRPFD